MKSRKFLESETPVSHYIPYSHHITETILSTKQADYLSVWKIGGRSHQGASIDDVFNWVHELNNMLRGIASANLALWSHIIRRKVYEYPQSDFENPFCQLLDQKYEKSFTSYNLMVNDLYLTVIYRPVTNILYPIFSHFESESLKRKIDRQTSIITELEDINRTLKTSLQRYHATLLGTYEKNGYIYSSALEFLSFLVNGEYRPIPVCRNRFYDYITFNRPFFSTWGEVGELRTLKDIRRFGMLEIREYSDSTEPGQFNILLKSDFEFILTQSFSLLSQYEAKKNLQRHQKNLIDVHDVARQQIEEIDEALDHLISGHFVIGEHHCTLTVFGDTVEKVRDSLAKASSSILDVGLIPKNVDLALESCYWAQLPCNWKWRARPAPITSLNFFSFSPFHNFMSGKPTGNPWGPAVTLFKTMSGTPLYFNFHSSENNKDSTGQKLLGNTMIIGQSSSGKTVLLGFLLAQAQKFKPTAVVFDKDRGMEIAVRAMGGRYLSLKIGEPSGFNPFHIESTRANRIFLKQFIKKLVSIRQEKITHQDEEEIEKALSILMSPNIEKSLRHLSFLLQLLPNSISHDQNARPTVHARLQKWCQGGEYGWLFDNEIDLLTLDTDTCSLYGFDITEFLDNPDTRTPIMMYLLYRTESMIDGQRFIYIFDEFWKALQDADFEDLAKNKQKTIRKQNGIFVFATQEPSDTLESSIAKTLIQQCATYIFLANPKAHREDYTTGFKLTDSEFDLVKELGEFSRRFLIKQGENSVIAQLDLNGFSDELLVLSGTPKNADMVEKIIAKVGNDPKIWLPLFFQKKNAEKGTLHE